jgi:transposase, IS5 family
MKQLGLNAPEFVKKLKLTTRQKFLQEMERAVPWALGVDRIGRTIPRRAGAVGPSRWKPCWAST